MKSLQSLFLNLIQDSKKSIKRTLRSLESRSFNIQLNNKNSNKLAHTIQIVVKAGKRSIFRDNDKKLEGKKRKKKETTIKIWLSLHLAAHVGRFAWEHNSENLYSHEEWTHSSSCTFLSSCECLAASFLITEHRSVTLLHPDAHGNIGNKWAVKTQAVLECVGGVVSPGGVHASTEDWTSTERLLEGMGIFLSLYFAKAAWTASVCRSKETHPLSQTYKIGALKLQIFEYRVPDLNRSSRALAALDLFCLETGITAWQEVWILLSICRDGSTPAEKEDHGGWRSRSGQKDKTSIV